MIRQGVFTPGFNLGLQPYRPSGASGGPATLLRHYRGLAAYLWEDTAATDQVETNGDGVQAWEAVGGGDLVTEATNFPTWDESDLAVTFDGSTFLAGSAADLATGTGAFSAAIWLNVNSLPTIFGIPVHWGGSGTTDQCGIYVTSTGTVLVGPGDGTYVESVTTLSLSTWTHVVMTYDGATLRWYFDGVLDNSGALTMNVGSYDFEVGGSFGFNYDGMLDGIKIYSGALTAGEVSTLFGLGR